MKARSIILLLCTLTNCISHDIKELEKSFSNRDWDNFVNAFPDTFSELMSIYGFDEEFGPQPLYDESYDHICFLFSNDKIRESQYIDKLLKLTDGFYWEADAPTYLGYNIWKLIDEYPALISELLQNKSDGIVKDFLKCAIATPHPEPENVLYYRDYLKTLQLYESYSPKIVRLLKEAHEELMEEFIE